MAAGARAEVPARRRLAPPRFALALPRLGLVRLAFFAIPVLWIVYYSFGYKPDIFSTDRDGDQLSFDSYSEALSADVPRRVHAARCRSRCSAPLLCFLIGFPFAYWLAIKRRRLAGGDCCSASSSCRSGRTSWCGRSDG